MSTEAYTGERTPGMVRPRVLPPAGRTTKESPWLLGTHLVGEPRWR